MSNITLEHPVCSTSHSIIYTYEYKCLIYAMTMHLVFCYCTVTRVKQLASYDLSLCVIRTVGCQKLPIEETFNAAQRRAIEWNLILKKQFILTVQWKFTVQIFHRTNELWIIRSWSVEPAAVCGVRTINYLEL